MKTFIELKDREDLPESINKKVYVLTMKWKKELDDFQRNPKTFESEEPKKREEKTEESGDMGLKKRKHEEIEEKDLSKLPKFTEKRGEKKKMLDRDRNKKKTKYERKKDPHYNVGKIREKDGSVSRSGKKKDTSKKTKNVK